MLTLLLSLRDCFRARAVLQAEILALRHQLLEDMVFFARGEYLRLSDDSSQGFQSNYSALIELYITTCALQRFTAITYS